MLEIYDLETGYGKKQVLFGVSMSVADRSIVGLIGPNGSGKSTILKTISGLISPWHGDLKFQGTLINSFTTSMRVAMGVTFAPQGNRIFRGLTVKENLEIGGYGLPAARLRLHLQDVLDVFPVLRKYLKRDAGNLSGGEQQLVALGRALMSRPKLLMLDEPSLGLSPKYVEIIFSKILEICQETEVSILIVEQRVRKVLEICQSIYSIKLGKIAFSGTPNTLKDNPGMLKDLFL